MTDLIKFLRTSTSSAYNKVAADRIEKLLELNKELTLQLLAVHGQAADALDKAVVAEAKLTKAKELVAQAFCEGFEDGHGGGYADSNSYPAWMRSYVLADLEMKE